MATTHLGSVLKVKVRFKRFAVSELSVANDWRVYGSHCLPGAMCRVQDLGLGSFNDDTFCLL